MAEAPEQANAPLEFDEASRTYIVAGLTLGNEIDGLVDSYYGPDELRKEAEQGPAASERLKELDLALANLEEGPRRDYLDAQARGLQTAARVHNGEEIPYTEEVWETFNIEPSWLAEHAFEECRILLDDLLPNEGNIRARLDAYRRQFDLDSDRVLPLANDLAAELRDLTRKLIKLPDSEHAEIKLVQNQPWSGYNWYLGDLHSRIEINTDLPVRANSLPGLIAHEIYCGHHTEHLLKEDFWVRKQGHGEASIALLTSPQAVISEGIATCAFDVLVGADDKADWLREHLYGPAGLTDVDIERDLEIQKATEYLRRATDNAAILVHQEGADPEETISYLMEHGLRTQAEAEQQLRFITTPILRCYIFTYAMGQQLVEDMLNAAEQREPAFRSLLLEPWTPQMLRESDDEGGEETT